jgi:hypothetical protein
VSWLVNPGEARWGPRVVGHVRAGRVSVGTKQVHPGEARWGQRVASYRASYRSYQWWGLGTWRGNSLLTRARAHRGCRGGSRCLIPYCRGRYPGGRRWAGSRIAYSFCSVRVICERRTADFATTCGASAVARRRSRPANGCESRCECEPVGVCTHLDLLSPCLIII